MKNSILFYLVLLLLSTFQNSFAQTVGYPITEPNYIQPIGNRPLDKTKPSVTLAGEVNIANGTATYSLPINLPPGVQGMQPNLAITYNSNGGNGQLGLGWALAGTSAISRGGSSHFIDGTMAPVTLTNDDNLYLDGQRLLPYDGKSGFLANAEYRTLTESYQKIEFIDNDIIKVTQKDGVIRYYGGDNARFQLKEPISQQFVTQSWFLFKVEDRNGNYMTYQYAIDAIKNEVRLEKINYTGNTVANASTKTEVQFRYMKRTDARSGFILGHEIHNTLLLKTVTVKHSNAQYSKYTLNYMFNPTPKLGNDFSKLVEIQYQAQTKGLNSVVVRWPEPTVELSISNSAIEAELQIGEKGQMLMADFNADGITDILALRHINNDDGDCWVGTTKKNIRNHTFEILGRFKTASGFQQSTIVPEFASNWKPTGCVREGFARLFAADFNGDGLVDFGLQRSEINFPNEPYNAYYFDIYLNDQQQPGNFTLAKTQYLSNIVWANGTSYYNFSTTNEPFQVFVSDFDGDGHSDFAHGREVVQNVANFGQTSTFAAHVYFVEDSLQFTLETYQATSLNALDSVYLGDFNGDAVNDLLMTSSGTSSKIISLAGRAYREIYSGGFPNAYHYILTGDYNGDGISDVLINNSSDQWLLSTFDGTKFLQATNLTGTFNTTLDKHFAGNKPNYLLNAPWPIQADYDEDGRMDILFFKRNGTGLSATYSVEVHYNKITGWELTTLAIPTSWVYYSWHGFQNFGVVDFSGDGSPELYFYLQTFFGDKYKFLIDFNPEKKIDKISSILDGANTQTTFIYKPLTNTTVYARGNTENYPNPVITAPLYVVSNVSQILFDGTTTANTNYQYQAARVNTLGLGLLGFEKITATDVVQGRRSVSTFALPTTQTQYKTQPMLPQKTEVFSTATNTLLASSEYAYYGTVVQTNSLISPWQYNPQVQEEKSKDFVHGTSAKSSLTYDAYGNPTSSTSYTYNNTTFATPYVSKTEEAATFTVQSGSWLPWLPSSTTTTVTRYGQTPAVQHSTFSYDAITGSLLTATANPGSEAEIATAYQYDDFGNPTQKTVTPQNMAARTTSYTYTTDGRFVETETNTLNWTVTYKYDDLKAVRTKQTDFNNLVTEWEYDEFGRVTKEIAPDGRVVNTTYAYFTGTNPTYLFHNTISGTAMPPSEEFLDGLGRARQKRSKNHSDAWVNVRTDFDSRGRQYRSSQPYFSGETPLWNVTSFDDNNRPTAISTAAGNSTTIVYSGRTTTTTNTSTGQTKSSTVDADGLTLTATDAGGSIAYTYNSFGKPVSITGPSGTPITSTYDAYGRQTELNDPAAGPMKYEYDALGQLVQQVDNAGNTYTITYDLMGRTTQKTGPEGNYTYTYDGGFLGAPETQTGPNNISTTTHYDALGRPEAYVETVNGTAYATQYTYTTNGQLATKTYPNGFGVNYAYDTHGYGYLSEMTRADDSRLIWQYTSENRFGQITDYMLGENTAWTKTYEDVSGLPTGIDNNKNWGMSYSFDVHTGNLNSRSHNYNGQSESFTYDPLDRLETYGPATAPQTVTYANTGSITTKTDAGTYTNHAPTGRTTAVKHPTGQPGFAISEVAQNITDTAFNSVETINEGNFDAFFTYGPDQQRKHMIINENGSTYIERYYLNGGSYERDRLPNGDWRNLTYISTPAGLSAVFIQNENTQEADLYFLHTDYQGSILAIANYQGDIVEEYSYDPWGNRRDPRNWQNIYTNTTSPTAGQSGGQSPLWGVGGLLFRGYTAHEHLDCFALINMNGRMYDPVLGRMLSADNFMHSGTQGLNRYSYVFNNPLKFTDPDGEIPFLAVLPAIIIGGAINAVIQARSGNMNNMLAFVGAFAVGGAAGAAGAYTGAAMVTQLGSFGFVPGAMAGSTGGFVMGAGNAWSNGSSFGQGLQYGLKSAASGFAAGALTGGLIGGFRAISQGTDFISGNKIIDELRFNEIYASDYYASTGELLYRNGDNILNHKFDFSDDYQSLLKSYVKARYLTTSGRKVPVKDLFDYSKISLGEGGINGWESNGNGSWTYTWQHRNGSLVRAEIPFASNHSVSSVGLWKNQIRLYEFIHGEGWDRSVPMGFIKYPSEGYARTVWDSMTNYLNKLYGY